jgi:hypothetical protein
MPIFILVRRHWYVQRTPWLRFCFFASAVVVLVVLCRRWSVAWVGAGALILFCSLFVQSKMVAEGGVRAEIYGGLLSAISTLFALMLAEGTLRMAPGLLPPGVRLFINLPVNGEFFSVPHPYIGHLHIAHANAHASASRRITEPGIETDSIWDMWGFRNSWPWPERVEIVAVGDSLTYSQMVHDDRAWTTILDRALPHSHVLNLGLIGGGPQQYLRLYETFGIGVTPKVLLVGLFLGNDLWDAIRFDRWWHSEKKESYHEFSRPVLTSGVQGRIIGILHRSYLFPLVRYLYESYRSGRHLWGAKRIELADGGRLQLIPSMLTRLIQDAVPGSQAFWLVLETLERIHTLTAQHNTHCVVLFLPSKEETYLPLIGEEAADLAAAFRPELDKRGISYLDVGPYFRQQATIGKTLFWEVDGHPNARGYAAIADVVFSHLKDNAKQYGLKDWEVQTSQVNP